MSILADELTGKPVSSLDGLKADDIKNLLNVPIGTRRLKCALLCLHALKNALHAYRGEPGQSWQETVDSH